MWNIHASFVGDHFGVFRELAEIWTPKFIESVSPWRQNSHATFKQIQIYNIESWPINLRTPGLLEETANSCAATGKVQMMEEAKKMLKRLYMCVCLWVGAKL